ncbi:hypothetical protein MD484_g7464, partial [Candolleomyces efflorescens]
MTSSASFSYFQGAQNITTGSLTFNNNISVCDALQYLHQHCATGAMHNSDERFPPPSCHPGTRQVALDLIIGWYSQKKRPKKPFMWVHAPAGYGKTTVAQTISNQLEGQTNGNFTPLGATIFFWRTSSNRNNPSHFVATLAYQFAMSIPELRPFIENAIKHDPMVVDKSLEVQLDRLIVQPFSSLQIDAMPNRLVVIDGLDECINSVAESRIEKKYAEDREHVQMRVLDLLNTLQSHRVPLSFLILSRSEPWIRRHFESEPFQDLVEVVDLYKVENHLNDVERYCRAEFSRIAKTLDYEPGEATEKWPSEEQMQALFRATQGHILYASTVIRHVDDPYDDPRQRLHEIITKPTAGVVHSTPFSSLHELYRQIMRSCPDSCRALLTQVIEEILACEWCFSQRTSISAALRLLDRISGRAPGRGMKVLRALHAVLRPVDGEDDAQDPNPRALDFFVHSSFAEFLENPQLSQHFSADRQQGYKRLSLGCIRCMSSITKQTIVFGSEEPEEGVRFAVMNWAWFWAVWKPVDEEEYLACLPKIFQMDLTASIVQALSLEPQWPLVKPFPIDLYTPGPGNLLFCSKPVAASNPLVQKGIAFIKSSVEDAFIYLLTTPSHLDSILSLERPAFRGEMSCYLWAVSTSVRVEAWGSERVLQALRVLRRGRHDLFVRVIQRVEDYWTSKIYEDSYLPQRKELLAYLHCDS